MAESALVSEDIEAARRLVAFLDSNGFAVKAALWLYRSEDDRWRFVISFREKRENVISFYRDIAKLMNRSGSEFDLLDLARVDFVDGDGAVVGPLSQVLQIDDDAGRRFQNNRINGVFLEDALIFRLSA
ncbi:MAG: hypothetical protein ACK4VM_13625 [Bosea sp. (in: a-proteobacteria)]